MPHSRPLIDVPAKAVTITERAEISPGTGEGATDAPGGESETKTESLEWRRKAANRRMQACSPDGSSSDAGYVPAFSARRMPDFAPAFDQPAEALTGKLVLAQSETTVRRTRLVVALGCLFSAVLVCSLAVVLLQADDLDAARRADLAAGSSVPEPALRAAERDRVELMPKAIETMKGFLNARTPEEKARFVCGGDAMLPAMRQYYSVHPPESPDLLASFQTDFGTDGRQPLIYVRGHSPDGRSSLAVLEKSGDGMQLDWRYFTGAGEMEWGRWIEQRPPHPVSLRVEATPDDYYSGPFADPKTWICLKITDVTHSASVWAYSERRGPLAPRLMCEFSGRVGPARLQGSFEFPAVPDGAEAGNPRTPQVILRELNPDGWRDHSPEAAGTPPASPPGSASKSD